MHDFERGQIDRIYETSEFVASTLRRVADDIDRAVNRARANEGTTDNFRAAYNDLPTEVVSLVAWGVANAHVESPARQLRELHLGRDSLRKVNRGPIAQRLQDFVDAWEMRSDSSAKIYTYITMEGPDDNRQERTHELDTDLLRAIIDNLNEVEAERG